ncbi:MAG: hypothetical protein ACLU4N_15845 [Butyricimonas faecihominis]
MMMIKSKWRFFSSCKAPSSFATEVKTGSGEKVQLEIFTEYLPGELSFPFDGVES